MFPETKQSTEQDTQDFNELKVRFATPVLVHLKHFDQNWECSVLSEL